MSEKNGEPSYRHEGDGDIAEEHNEQAAMETCTSNTGAVGDSLTKDEAPFIVGPSGDAHTMVKLISDDVRDMEIKENVEFATMHANHADTPSADTSQQEHKDQTATCMAETCMRVAGVVRAKTLAGPAGDANTIVKHSTDDHDDVSDVEIETNVELNKDIHSSTLSTDTYSKRGNAIFVVNQTGTEKTEFEYRPGANEDLKNLKTVFCDKLNFSWVNKQHSMHYNLGLEKFDCNYKSRIETSGFNFYTHMQCACLKFMIDNLDHTDCESFVFAISSHGGVSVNTTTGEKDTYFLLADGHRVFVSEILEWFNDENCPTLKDNPKIFIFQCCRSDPEVEDPNDYGVEVPVAALPAPRTEAESSDSEDDQSADDEYDPVTSGNTTRGTSGEFDEEKDIRDVSYNPNVYGVEVPVAALPAPRTEAESSDSEDDQSADDEYDPVTSGNTTRGTSGEFDEEKDIRDVSYSAPHNNQLVIYASPVGKRALRNSVKGSWMIGQLKTEMDKHKLGEPVDFLKILTQVAGDMSRMESKGWKRDINNKLLKDDKGKKIVDEEKSGLKNAMSFSHRLTQDLVLKTIVAGNELANTVPPNVATDNTSEGPGLANQKCELDRTGDSELVATATTDVANTSGGPMMNQSQNAEVPTMCICGSELGTPAATNVHYASKKKKRKKIRKTAATNVPNTSALPMPGLNILL